MNSTWKINFWHLCLGIALIIVMTRAASQLPHSWYFSFSRALYGVPQRPEWPAILVKFLIPVVAGCFIGFLSQDNPRGTAGAVGFSAAFILAWPALNNWKLYVEESLVDREYAFKLVYLFYFAAYYYLAICGARLTTIYLNYSEQQGQTRINIIRGLLDWEKSLKPLLFGGIGGTASLIFSQIFSQQ